MCVNLAIVNGGRNALYASDFWPEDPGIAFRTCWNVPLNPKKKATKVFLPGDMMIELLPNPPGLSSVSLF